ncbi:acyltransferase [Variovorax ureilyticus]|uniref:Acyltransferase n=1 Tax=Variovorax ureilyticus TaxID=1836198 RepID=A0ABU8VES8_9BURK
MRLPAVVRGIGSGLVLGLNTLAGFAPMVVPALGKGVLPAGRLRNACDRLLNAIAGRWVAINNAWIAAVCREPWRQSGLEGLNRSGWYLVSVNHQSWVDILVLQRVFHGRIPFLKFFLKQQLIWVPFMGLAWWALDFPFMKRGGDARTQRGDLAATREACEKFKRFPTTVINFVEGTRFTCARHAGQHSRYRHLLEPRMGGIGVALQTMGERFDAMLDVTIVYPGGTPTFWDLLSGRLRAVTVDVRRREIPAALIRPGAPADRAYRQRLREWIELQWAEKDSLIPLLLKESPHVAGR